MIKYILALLITTSLYAGDGDVVQPEAIGQPAWTNFTYTMNAENTKFLKDGAYLYDPVTRMCDVQFNHKVNDVLSSGSAYAWSTSSITVDESNLANTNSSTTLHAIGFWRSNHDFGSAEPLRTGVLYYNRTNNLFIPETDGGNANNNQLDNGDVFSSWARFPCSIP